MFGLSPPASTARTRLEPLPTETFVEVRALCLSAAQVSALALICGFALEHAQRGRVGVVRLHEAVLLALEPVAVGGEAFQFLGFGGHERVELVVEHPRECVLLSRRDLDARVVAFDEFLDVLDEYRLARAVGALGVPAGADEVAVGVAVAVLRVGDDEP